MSTPLNFNNKNSTPLNFRVKRGANPVIQDVANLTFNDEMFNDGTLVKDTKFEELQNPTPTYLTKNSASLNFPAKP